jgi:hypothetical protein
MAKDFSKATLEKDARHSGYLTHLDTQPSFRSFVAVLG